MDYLVYLCYRACTGLVSILPLALVCRLGQLAGWLGYVFLRPYRRLAMANLEIAYGDRKSAEELRRLARQHFILLGANLLSSVKVTTIASRRLEEIAPFENKSILQEALDRGRGVVLVLSHIGNWEMFAEVCQFFPGARWGTIYQPLGNRYIEAHVQRMRTGHGVVLFNRKSGFNGPTAFLRTGGAVGVLVDQHAGDGGVWTPFFGRLASTSNLAALLALRTGAELVPLAVYTDGAGRWRVTVSPPIEKQAADGTQLSANALTARINQVLERQIERAPADWFWVHNRWKTPRPRFLLASYRRGIAFAPGEGPERLKPFRILIRSTNWLGDAVMTIPAVQAIAAGRPDAQITVLTPAKLADLWRAVPGVHAALPFEPGWSFWRVALAIHDEGPFDAAVVLPNSLRSALEPWLAGVPRRVGYAGHSRQSLLTQVVREPPNPARQATPGTRPRTAHQSERYAHLAQEIGAVEIPINPGTAARVEIPRGAWARVGICPGAEYGPTKRWFPERFAEAAQAISAGIPCEWVLFGTAKDAEFGTVIEKSLRGHCENLIGKTSLADLIGHLRRCQGLLTNDTGTMHLAAWLGVPVVAVFGSTSPALTGPIAPPERVRILRHQVACSPCFLPQCPLDLRCLKVVRAQEAAEALLELLGRSEAR